MVQAFGYLLAAVGPVLLGFAYDQSHSWKYPILIIHLANILMLVASMRSVHSKAALD